MRVLVTGGAGFIGAWIIRHLVNAGHEPVVFDLAENRGKVAEIAGVDIARSVAWITGDIGDTDAVTAAAKGCSGVIHLAGLLTPACRANPVLGAKVNLIGTLNAFLAARANAIPSVSYMSSAGVFGPDGGEEPHPTTLYGAFKLAAELSANAFHLDDGIGSIGFRPFVVYGPGREEGLSAGPTLACRAAVAGEAYTIPFTGLVDMIHVEDVARVFVAAVENPGSRAHVVNLIGQQVSADDIARTIRNIVPGARIDASGPPLPIESPKTDKTMQTLFPDWRPIGLSDGLGHTVNHYRRLTE